MDKFKTPEIICFAIGGIVVLYILMTALPYIIVFLAICGAWSLWEKYDGSGKR